MTEVRVRVAAFAATAGTLLGLAGPVEAVVDPPYWTTYPETPLCSNARCETATLACESRRTYLEANYFPDIILTRMAPFFHQSGSFSGIVCHFARSGGGSLPGWAAGLSSLLNCPSGNWSKDRQGCFPTPQYVGSLERTCQAGNPVIVGSGAKIERQVDFATAGPFKLEFARYYNAQRTRQSTIGSKWGGSFDRSLSIDGWNVYANRPDGEVMKFYRSNDVNYYRKVGNTWVFDSIERMIKTATGWEFKDAAETVETYDTPGNLLSIRKRGGYELTIGRDGNGHIVTVTDNFGRQIGFTYVDDKLESMIAPDGGVYRYLYDDGDPATDDRLGQVVYPDDTPGDDSDNPRITYLYEDPDYPFALTGIIDENGDRFATFAYDGSLRATLSEHAGGVDRTTVSYDDANLSRTTTNALGKQTTYHFAEIQRKWKVTQVEGHASANCVAANASHTYNDRGFVNSTTDWNGNLTTDLKEDTWRDLTLSRTEAVATPEQRLTTYSWHANYRLPTQIVQPGRTIDLTYDADGRLLARTETDTTSHSVPYGTNGETRTWAYTWTPEGLLASVDGPRTDVSDVTAYAYGASGFLASVTDALGHVTEITAHDAAGRPLTIVDENGIETTLAYTPRGWLEAVTVDSGPGGAPATTSFTYDDVGQITRVVLPDGAALNYEYDAAHRLVAVSNDFGERIEYTLDAMGNRTGDVIKAAGGTTRRTQARAFDELGRLLQNIGAAGQTFTYGYDKSGNVISETDGLSRTWAYAFDALDRLIQETDPLAGATDYGYDGQDELTDVTDPIGLTTAYVRDGFGRVIQEDSPDRGVTVYAYDAAGNLVEQTDARGVVTEYAYDALNRMVAKTFPASPPEDVAYGYDDTTGGNFGIGRLTGVVDAGGATDFVYDARGNLIEEIRTTGSAVYTTSYAYDLADRLVEIVYPSGRIVSYERDALGRVSAVSTQDDELAPVVMLATNMSWLPFGPLASLDFGNGLGLTLSYDQDYRLTAIQTDDGGSNQVQDLALGYDANDHVTAIADGLDPGNSQSFAYDELWRLEQAVGAYGTIDYAYDAGGNRLSRTITDGGSTVETYAYDAFSNRLLSVSDGAATRSFGYAADGSVVSDDRGTDAFDLLYGATGRLAAIDKNGAPAATYGYDAFGRRALKDLVVGGATHFVYDPDGRLLAESTGSGVPEREYVWLPLDGQPWALPVALVTEAGTAGPRLHYLHADHLGTPQVMTSAGFGQVEWSATFRPFGEAYALTGSESLALRFPGQFFDPETGFHQNWHRDYDPRLGRYLQSDPIGLGGGLNSYAYVGGNPVNLIDPEGLVAPAITAILTCLSNPSCALPAIGTTWLLCEAAGDVIDRFLNEDATSQTAKPLLGNNSRPGKNRTNTDLPGGRAAAEELFERETRGQKTTTEPMQNGGTRTTAEDGTQIRRNPDGSTRVDLPGRGPKGNETIHF